MKKIIRNVLPHVAIVISLMYVVFFFIDRVNSAMCFINNGMTKTLLLILAVVSALIAKQILADDRKRREIKRRLARKNARTGKQ